MFECIVVAAFMISIVTGRWELFIIFGVLYLACGKREE